MTEGIYLPSQHKSQHTLFYDKTYMRTKFLATKEMPIGDKIQTSSNPGEEVWVKRLEPSKIFLIRPSVKSNAFILIVYLFDYIIIKVFLNVIVHRRAQRDNLKSVVFEETSYSNCSVAATC